MVTLLDNGTICFAAIWMSDRSIDRAWLFSMFLFLALVKPFDIDNGNRYMGMVLVLLVAGTCFSTLHREDRWREVWREYCLEISLIVALVLIYLVSLLVHLNVYPTWLDVVVFGTPQFTLLAMFGMAWMIFSYREPTDIVWPAMLMLLILNGIAILQAVNYDLAAPLTSWFVAADYGRPNVSSLFRINTVYGITAALIFVYGVGELVFKSWSLNLRAVLIVLVLLAFIGGMLSGSRGFLLTIVVGLLVMGIYGVGSRPKTTLVSLTTVAIIFHAIVWLQPNLAADYGRIIPYMGKLDRPMQIQCKDFVPIVANEAFGNRINHWRRAQTAWQDEPWLGIGPGVFRMNDLSVTGKKSVTNPHNIFLQTLVDTGIIGLLILMLLLGRIIQRVRDPVTMAVCVSLLAGHVVENLFDKSMAFTLIAAWLLSEPLAELDGSDHSAA